MRVLFATDGSESSNAALAMLEVVADREAIDLTVLSVSPFKAQGAGQPLVPPQMLSDVRDRHYTVANEATRRLEDAKFQVTARVDEGNTKKRIVEIAESDDFDLVLVGAGEHSWFDKLLLGSTSRYVLHRTSASVLVVHELRRRAEPVRVLVASDGSPAAEAAAERLRQFADPSQCVVTVLSVAQTAAEVLPPISRPEGDLEGASQVQNYLAEEALRSEEAARSVAQAEAARFRAEGFRVEEELAVGGPTSRVILDEAHREGYDLVVVGSSGLNPVEEAVLGSTGDAVARNTRAALVGRPAPSQVEDGSGASEL
ncbi:MAG: universal stress protein [Actinobacteria bacterium]|nr:universal stress protein [Actinomycetota bacterium]